MSATVVYFRRLAVALACITTAACVGVFDEVRVVRAGLVRF